MFYVIGKRDYEEYSFVGLLEGPNLTSPLDIDKLADDFLSEFNQPKLGGINYPEYKGPKTKTNNEPGFLYSGISLADSFSEEYKEWISECNEIRDQWIKRREDKIEEWKEKYPGNDIQEMFLSYLEIEHGLKKVECTHVYI